MADKQKSLGVTTTKIMNTVERSMGTGKEKMFKYTVYLMHTSTRDPVC